MLIGTCTYNLDSFVADFNISRIFDPDSRTMSTKQTSKVMYTLSFQERRGDKDVQIQCRSDLHELFDTKGYMMWDNHLDQNVLHVVVERAMN